MRPASGPPGHTGREFLQTSRRTYQLQPTPPAVSLSLNLEVF